MYLSSGGAGDEFHEPSILDGWTVHRKTVVREHRVPTELESDTSQCSRTAHRVWLQLATYKGRMDISAYSNFVSNPITRFVRVSPILSLKHQSVE